MSSYFFDKEDEAMEQTRFTAETVRAAVAAERERCAKIADAHKGSYAKRAGYGVSMKFASEETRAEVRSEERGEDIAAEMIAAAIRKAN